MHRRSYDRLSWEAGSELSQNIKFLAGSQLAKKHHEIDAPINPSWVHRKSHAGPVRRAVINVTKNTRSIGKGGTNLCLRKVERFATGHLILLLVRSHRQKLNSNSINLNSEAANPRGSHIHAGCLQAGFLPPPLVQALWVGLVPVLWLLYEDRASFTPEDVSAVDAAFDDCLHELGLKRRALLWRVDARGDHIPELKRGKIFARRTRIMN
jgi:hypothetical protein